MCVCATSVSLLQTNTTYLILASSSKIFAVVTTFPYKVIKSRLMQVHMYVCTCVPCEIFLLMYV